MLVLGFQEDGWVPHPSPLPLSVLHLASDAAENFLADLLRWLSVGCFLLEFIFSLLFVERSLDESFLNVNWLAVYHEPESCYLSRESLFVEPQSAAGHQSYPSLVLISM